MDYYYRMERYYELRAAEYDDAYPGKGLTANNAPNEESHKQSIASATKSAPAKPTFLLDVLSLLLSTMLSLPPCHTHGHFREI
jgi:hypothetical protein